MKLKIDNDNYEVIVTKKANKNTYIRVKEDLNIYVTTNYKTNDQEIVKLLKDNALAIKKMINKQQHKKIIATKCYYLGNEYQVVYLSTVKEVTLQGNKIFMAPKTNLDLWYQKEATHLFKERLTYIVDYFKEPLPVISLKIRKMKTRWGVCNRHRNYITLNLDLITKEVAVIDYVIIHELCHFIYPNHSQNFWQLVSSYVPNYKKIRKKLKDI